MYLIHVPVVATLLGLARTTRPGELVGWTWPTAAIVMGLVAVCFVVATASYVLIERPCLALKRGLG
jgi:peptidoglycan/LPS O-acetylase OafA/YrhL